jgi:hypothetical protein
MKQHNTTHPHPNVRMTIHKYFWEVKKDEIDKLAFTNVKLYMVAIKRTMFDLFHIRIWL